MFEFIIVYDFLPPLFAFESFWCTSWFFGRDKSSFHFCKYDLFIFICFNLCIAGTNEFIHHDPRGSIVISFAFNLSFTSTIYLKNSTIIKTSQQWWYEHVLKVIFAFRPQLDYDTNKSYNQLCVINVWFKFSRINYIHSRYGNSNFILILLYSI